MAEGSETPNGERSDREDRPRREADLFAERRARRATESGEAALTRRAEAAEATVQTLERHVASLQQRLREAEDERQRVGELVEAEQADALERERELRRVKQREYAEQQLRVEAEDRLLAFDRDSRVEIEQLSSRLGVSEQEARELARRLDGVQRRLAEAQQAQGAERAAARAELRSVAEQNLQPRLAELERRAEEIQRGLDSERAARERSEQLLDGMREGHRRMEVLLGEMKGIVGRVTMAISASAHSEPRAAHAPDPQARGAEMADALASAVERLRARAALSPEGEAVPETGERPAPAARELDAPSQEASQAEAQAAEQTPSERLAPVVRRAAATPSARPAHKHSMSWFGRMKMRRKQRRAR